MSLKTLLLHLHAVSQKQNLQGYIIILCTRQQANFVIYVKECIQNKNDQNILALLQKSHLHAILMP